MTEQTNTSTSGDSGADTGNLDRMEPRDRLVRAGMLVLDELPLHKVFAGATTAAVAERAGVTTGSFFHHFANAAAFADAIALSFAEIPDDVGDAVEEIFDSLQHIDLFEVLHSSLADTWQIYMSDEVIQLSFRGQMQLWAHHEQRLSEPVDGFETVADILRRTYLTRQTEAVAVWQHLLDRTGRKVVPPFTVERLATALTSLFHGLVIRRAVNGESVDDELFADIVTALAAALTVPLGSRLRLSDLALPLRDETGMSPQARSGARRRRETRARITTASADLFDRRGWESVSATEVAERAGVSPQTVMNLFPSVRSVAATVFARHTPDIRRVARGESSTDPAHPSSDPRATPIGIERLRATLVRLAECVSADPEPARALVGDRLAAHLQRGGELAEHDIRLEVPLADSVMYALSPLDIGDHEPIAVTRMLIDFVLTQGLDKPNREAETAELALRLLPDSALVSAAVAAE